jgi:hypothetical protein
LKLGIKHKSIYNPIRESLWPIIKAICPLLPWLISKYRSHVIENIFTEVSYGEITLVESIFLSELIQGLTVPGPIVEIGTLFGRSTLVIAANKDSKRELITIDNYSWNPLGLKPEVHSRITHSILAEAIDNLNLKRLCLDKNSFYSLYRGSSPALVFLDAIHTYEETKADIQWAKSVNAHLICGHDYNEQVHPEVVKAVNEFGGPRKLVESIWVI